MIYKKTFWLWPEMVLVYLIIPLIQKFGLIDLDPMLVLVGMALIFAFILWIDHDFSNHRFYRWSAINWKKHLIVFGGVTVIVSIGVYFIREQLWLQFPTENTRRYLLALLLYPLVSVIPQEIIYRGYFYHRYHKLFKSEWIMILINSFLFGFTHIIFDNWIAPVGAFLISFIFSFTYLKTKSLPIVVLEHYCYGIMIFTVGLGHYFK